MQGHNVAELPDCDSAAVANLGAGSALAEIEGASWSSAEMGPGGPLDIVSLMTDEEVDLFFNPDRTTVSSGPDFKDN